MSHPGLVPGGSRTPQRLRRFGLIGEWMVDECRHSSTIHSPISEPRCGEQYGQRLLQKIRDDS